MSQWTHVCGCIRVDAIRGLIGDTRETLKEKLGRIVDFEDDDYTTILPCGSEGSIEYEILENPDEQHIAAFTVPIWGDLRDYSSVEYIKEWFNKVCDSIMMVRDAVLSIEVEYGKCEIIHYEKKKTNQSYE